MKCCFKCGISTRNGYSDLSVSVVFRGKAFGRITAEDYDEAIRDLQDAKSQLEPDGDNCHVCGDDSHQAWECRHNPLVMARRAAQMEYQWRCFHCGDVFTDAKAAADHFGSRGDEKPAACGAMLNAFAEEFERYGVHRNFHNAASVRLLVVDIARRCAQIANELEDDDCTAGAVWEAIRNQLGLSKAERGMEAQANGTIQTETSGADAKSGPGSASQSTSEDAVASVEAKEGGVVLFAGLFPVCQHCFKPEMNCDCDVPFEPLVKRPTADSAVLEHMEIRSENQ